MKNTLAKNTTFLTIAGVISKILGGMYKFPLIKVLGTEGLGIYGITFPILQLFLVLGSNAFPLGISKCVAKNENKQEEFSYSLFVSFLISLIFSIIVLSCGKLLSNIQGLSSYYIIYYFFAPTIIFSFLLGAYRGYFQGIENMKVVAISQIIEQTLKIILGIFLCLIMMRYGLLQGLIGVFLGILLSEIITTIFLFLIYKKQNNLPSFNFNFKRIKNVIKQIFPLCLSQIISPLASSLVSILIIPLLSYFSVEMATRLFGYTSQVVGSIINIPLILTTSLSISLLPNISQRVKDKQNVNNDINQSIMAVYYISMFFSFIFFIFSREISDFLITLFKFEIELTMLSNFFKLAAISIFYTGLLQVLNSILEGLGKSFYTLTNIILGTAFRIILLIVLARIEVINLYAIYLSEIFGASLTVLLQVLLVKKYVKINVNLSNLIIKPLIILGGSNAIILVLKSILPINFVSTLIKGISCLICIILLIFITDFLNIKSLFKNLKIKLKLTN